MRGIDRRNLLAMGSAAALASAWKARADEVAGPPPLDVYIRSPIVEQIALSPDGKRIAFISPSGDGHRLGYFDIDNPTVQATNLGPLKIRDLIWGDNNHIIFVNSHTARLNAFVGGRHEFLQANVLDVRTREAKRLLFGAAGFADIIFGSVGRIKVGDQYRPIAQTPRMDGDYELTLFSFELDSHAVHNLGEGTQYAEGFVTTPEGRAVAYSEMDDDRHVWRLFYNKGAEGTAPQFQKIYEVRDAEHFPDLMGLGRDGKALVIALKNTNNDGKAYHEISADGVVGPVLDNDGTDRTRRPLFHPTSKRLCGFEVHDDWFTYRYDDDLMKRLAEGVPQVIGADRRFTLVDFAEDPRKMLVRSESADDAGSYTFIDFSTGDTKSVAFDYPALPAQWLSDKKPILYKSADGLDIHGYLTLPPNKAARDLPLIVLPHGGPQERDYIGFDPEPQAFASRGYAVLQPNFRGSTGYGAAFRDAGNGEWGRKMQSDLRDGIADLARQGIVDPKRVAIYGASYGGYAALAGATLDPAGTYRCAVSIAGVSDLPAMIDAESQNVITTNSSYLKALKTEFGDPQAYGDISPARQAAKAYCPVLMIHGTDDTVVPIDQSQRMERALKAAGKDVRLITYEGQDHWETLGAPRIAMFAEAMAFIQKNNPA